MEFGSPPVVGGDDDIEVLLEDMKEGKLVMKRFKRSFLNARWMDVGLTRPVVQCKKDEGTCKEMEDTPMWRKDVNDIQKHRKKWVVDVGKSCMPFYELCPTIDGR